MSWRCIECGYVLREDQLELADAEYCPACHAMGTILEEEE